MCSLILCILILAVMLIVMYCTNRGLFWSMLLGLCALAALGIYLHIQEKQNAKGTITIERTEILSKVDGIYNERTGKYVSQTTFILYFYDGTQKKVTVENGSEMYDEYMIKLK